ncbi:CocE/NonD family hydrolase [Natronoglycomyces albus]|uniref:Xaa-Pro dipeptidyl-peptidase C-terminal domain-containing protein n=1 Tax=Natronoglycomyces albus TaxID=2811108 RepID=A0A895XG78_9ACTN|nr:CocE/NonD family hydrolase [Natronoglycomyces albus]QSB04871.1 hypothetical protein JQS30_14050 [Natronoglycomyces albus]
MNPRKPRRLLAASLAGAVAITGWAATAAADPNTQETPEAPFDFLDPIPEAEYDLDDAVWETVWVQSDFDSDGDGELDKIAVEIVRPATDEGVKVPVIAQPSPYYDLIPIPELFSQGEDGRQIPIDPNTVPRHFMDWKYTHFVEHGYAYIEPEMQGTAQSDGCPTTGGVEDTQSITAVVDWLAGRTTATYEDGTEAVADWAEPSVGMLGTSYNGTLPNAVAATGIEEVKAIIPIAAISSWYDYTRAEGIGLRWWDDEYVSYLAEFVANENAREVCRDLWKQMDLDADDVTFDYNDFWAERDYTTDADQVHAAVLHVHGQNDHNVKTTHTGRWWEALGEHDVDQSMWLFPGAHADPTTNAASPWALEGRALYHSWFDHYLKGVDNGVAEAPSVIVTRDADTADFYEDWPNPNGEHQQLYLGEDADGFGTLSGDDSSTGVHTVSGDVPDYDTIVVDPGTQIDERAVFLTDPVEGDQHLSGIVDLDLTFTSSSSSTALSAVLVHYYPGEGLVTFITHAGADAKNHESLWAEEALVPGQEYTMNIPLEPRDVIIPDGNRIGLALVTNHPTMTTHDPLSDVVDFHLGDSVLNLHLTPVS